MTYYELIVNIGMRRRDDHQVGSLDLLFAQRYAVPLLLIQHKTRNVWIVIYHVYAISNKQA
jgi:hypothetical protein